MKTKMKTSTFVIIMTIAVIVALYTLAPFFLVCINVLKNANGIVADPVSLNGASFQQLLTNLTNVINNSNFSFWYAFGTSALITIVSLILLALFGGMADEMHALLCDGRTHKVEKPKRKKLRHMKATGRAVAEAARRIEQGESMQDHEIRNWLSNEEG